MDTNEALRSFTDEEGTLEESGSWSLQGANVGRYVEMVDSEERAAIFWTYESGGYEGALKSATATWYPDDDPSDDRDQLQAWW
ncbi:MAG TPA: hypothetical protein VMR52_13230 [Dehalococcoidia bacterium]|nr:hypothetical protein [Dehalococcoidia bacterium]